MIKNKIKNIVLTAGHGGGDPGAVSNSGRQEQHNVVKIIDYIMYYNNQFPIVNRSFEVFDRENRFGLARTIQELNKKFPFPWNNSSDRNYLLLEIHQDMNAPHLELERQKWQFGVYRYNNDNSSKQFAQELIENAIKNGAYEGTKDRTDFNGAWERGHYLPWAGFHLGFIQNTRALSMILELGYISADHTDKELKKLAYITYSSLYKMLTNVDLKDKINEKIINEKELIETLMLNELKNQYWETLLKNGVKYMSQDRQAVIKNALDMNNFEYLAGEQIMAWDVIDRLQQEMIEVKEQILKLQAQNTDLLNSKNEVLANNVILENPPVYFEAVEQNQNNGVKKISHLTLNNVTDNTSVINSSNKIQDIINNTIKKVTGNDKIKNASSDLLKETVQATKTKSWKRFTASLVYFLLTIGVVILNSVLPNNQAINGIYEFVSNTNNLALLTFLTGGYITAQTISDISPNNK